jgi:hypothetical protein
MIYLRNTEEQVDGWTQGHRECGFRPGAKIVMLSCWNAKDPLAESVPCLGSPGRWWRSWRPRATAAIRTWPSTSPLRRSSPGFRARSVAGLGRGRLQPAATFTLDPDPRPGPGPSTPRCAPCWAVCCSWPATTAPWSASARTGRSPPTPGSTTRRWAPRWATSPSGAWLPT